jgi:TP901 family phage tail tape measure protein
MLGLTAALGAGAGLAGGIQTIAAFSQAMSTVQAVTNATASQFDLLEAKAKFLGATTRFSATEAAEGMLFLARAGFDVNAVLGSIEGTLQLAQAGALDLGAAADIASNILSGFRLDVSETGRVVDVLAKLANSANTDITQLGEAMKFVAPVAAGLGVSVEEAAAAVGSLSDAGLQSSLAGTGLRRVLSELESPSSKSVKIFKELGVSVDEVRPSAVGLTPALQRLAKAGLDTGQALEVFGDRGGPAFEVLASSLPKVVAQTKALQDAGGTASRVSTIMDDNLAGAIKSAQSAFEALTLAMGEAGAEPALRAAFQGLADLLRFAAANADILGVAIVALSARAIVPFAISAGVGAVAAVQRLQAQLVILNAIAGRTTGVISILTASAGGLAAALGPTTLIIAGLAVAYIAFARNAQTAQERTDRANASIAKTNAVLAETKNLVGDSDSPMKQIAGQAEDAAEKVANLTSVIDDLNKGLKNLREEGQVATAIKIGEAIAENEAAVRQLEGQRSRAGQRAFNAPNLGGRRGLQQNIDRELAAFDQSEEGQRLLFLRQQRAILDQRLRSATEGLTFGDLARQFREGTPETEAATGAATKAVQIDREALFIKQQLAAIDLARAEGNEALARNLQDELDIITLTAEYMELVNDELVAQDLAIRQVVELRQAETAELRRQADLERQKREDAAALAIEQAQADRALILARAKGNDDEIRALEEILDFRRRVAEYEGKGLSSADAIDQAEADIRAVNALRQSEMRQAIADEIAAGLTEGIRTGDWGTVFKDILAKSTTDALSDAINDLASILTDLFSSAIKGLGGSAGNSIGASIASLFGGGRAGGGSVAAGMRYIVGEQGPEMFVPSVPGTIVPQFEGPASAAANGVMGIQSMTITAPFIVQGSITEEVFPRVQAMMAAQARELPRIIDARVTDSLRRNRY